VLGGVTPHRKRIYVKETSAMPRTGLTNRRRPGCREKELILGTWNVRTLFKNALQLLEIRGWRKGAGKRDEWRRLMREAKTQKGLKHHIWMDIMYNNISDHYTLLFE